MRCACVLRKLILFKHQPAVHAQGTHGHYPVKQKKGFLAAIVVEAAQGLGVAGQIGAQPLAEKARTLVAFAGLAGWQKIKVVLMAVETALSIFGQQANGGGALLGTGGKAGQGHGGGRAGPAPPVRT